MLELNHDELAARTRLCVRDIPDFPQPGILFKDITPVLADRELFRDLIEHFANVHRPQNIDVVVGIESRGFIFGAPLALALGAGFVPIRKPGKLPYRSVRVDYALEYGRDALEAHEDAIARGQRTLVVDDVLATGGTAGAAIRLVQELGGYVAAVCFLIELGFLEGRAKLGDVPVHALVRY
jgi:adenine phosphoribosyltransferase